MLFFSRSSRVLRRKLLTSISLLVVVTTTACGNSREHLPSGQSSATQDQRIQAAVGQLDKLALSMMERSGIPGMAIAVVRGDQVLYAKGLGLRQAGRSEKVDPDTVFALASMSKPLGATVIARQVTLGRAAWSTPIQQVFPWFTLADTAVSAQVTVGDMYAHRSGLPNHAGDPLEELSFDQNTILRRMHQLPLTPFRQKFEYTNYGMTSAAISVATLANTDWASLCQETLYQPLGMTSTSSRFADFLARPNRAPGHVKERGQFVLGPERPLGTGEQRWSTAWNTDAQSPSGGVSSSAKDIARWMSFVLKTLEGEDEYLSQTAFRPAVTPQITIYEAQTAQETSMYYGFGFFIDKPPTGGQILHHGGAFSWGTGTNFALLPSANVGIVVLTNAWPTGVAEALSAEFLDHVQFGKARKDWYGYYSGHLATAFDPQGDLVGLSKPQPPTPSRDRNNYAGVYSSPYYGEVQVVSTEGGLELRLGLQADVRFPLHHWDGDIFSFAPFNDSVGPGSLSKADFTGGRLVLEYYNKPHSGTEGLGVFTRVP